MDIPAQSACRITCLPCMSLIARMALSGVSKRSRPAHLLMPVLGSVSILQDDMGPNACKGTAPLKAAGAMLLYVLKYTFLNYSIRPSKSSHSTPETLGK